MTTIGLFSFAPSESWMQQAACRESDPELFFANGVYRHHLQAAKAVCRACPVANQCLTYALQHNEPWGVWGGLTETERKDLTGPRKTPTPGPHCATLAGAYAHYRHREQTCEPCRRAAAVARRNKRHGGAA